MELIIVIVIMGVVYTLSVTNFQNLGGSNTQVSLKNLKEYLYNIPHTKSVELLCLDNCLRCSVLVDSKEYISTTPFDDIIDDTIRVYRYDFYTGIQEQSKKVYFNSEDVQEDVCFSYSVDKRGIGEQVIVEFKDKVYDFSTYLSSTSVYDSLEEVVEFKDVLAQEVLR
ncbi:hypothetical protein HUE88_03890 [Candidatus Sulfurimonas baltica]|uniref:Uncharacterized protein n=2 Tax=Candidatus Sulfurimonas baltica TaxID=2740404 RepID=A0A7S7LWN4_9BACT|nr:hypothetical protein HUE88_03890 [Candidatus Sulfurimonas baltica]